MRKKKVTGRRVYVTFLHDGTIALHPSNCTGPYYRMRNKGSIHLSKHTPAAKLGQKVLAMRDQCQVT
jgi:hypothetical protein